jgi:hypothetical protein
MSITRPVESSARALLPGTFLTSSRSRTLTALMLGTDVPTSAHWKVLGSITSILTGSRFG